MAAEERVRVSGVHGAWFEVTGGEVYMRDRTHHVLVEKVDKKRLVYT